MTTTRYWSERQLEAVPKLYQLVCQFFRFAQCSRTTTIEKTAQLTNKQ